MALLRMTMPLLHGQATAAGEGPSPVRTLLLMVTQKKVRVYVQVCLLRGCWQVFFRRLRNVGHGSFSMLWMAWRMEAPRKELLVHG